MAGYPYTNQVTDDNAKKAIIAAFDRISVLTAAQDALQTSFNALSSVAVVTSPTGTVTPLPPSGGGTGLGSFNSGDLLVADTPTSLIGLPDIPTGNVLLAGGSGVIPFYGKVGLTTHVSGVLPEGNGGTNQSTYTTGDLLYASAANTLSKLADVAAGSYLRSGGVGVAPLWSTITLPNAAAVGDIWYGSAASVISALAKDANATRYLSNTGASNIPAWAQVNLANGVTGVLPYANFVNATAASILVGRGSAAGAGVFQEITLGANLTMTGTVLSATGGSGSPAGADTQVQFNDATAFGGASALVYNKTTLTVGIGVAPSGAKLDIVSAATANNLLGLRVNQQDTDANIAEFQAAGTRTFLFTYGGTDEAILGLYTGGTLKVSLLANGTSSFNGGGVLFGTGSVTGRVTMVDSGSTAVSVLSIVQDDDNLYALAFTNTAASQEWRFYIANTDELILRDITNARNPIIFYPTTTVFNEAGADNDLRMEGDTEANLFFLDASTDRIGVATASPAQKLHVVGNGSFEGLSLPNTGGAATSGQLTLVAGTKTINTTAATASCLIFFQRKSTGGTIGFATTYTVSAGTSFTLTSDSALDTSVYNWWIVETH